MGLIARRAPRTRRQLAVVAVAAVAALGAAGCGASSASTGAGAGDVAGFIPADSPVYMEVSTDVGGPQWTQTVALAKRFPDYEKLVAKITEELASEKIDFEGQIRPLLGDTAAVGVTDLTGMTTGGGDPAFVVAVDLVDGKDAEVLALLQGGADPAKKVGQHDGVDLYADSETTFAVLDGTLLVSDAKERVTGAIDAHRGGDSQTMAGSDTLERAFAQLPDGVLARAFVDVAAAAKAAGSAAGGVAAKQLQSAGLGPDAALGVSVSAETDGARLKAVGIDLGSLAGASDPFTPKLVAKAPADAIAYVGVRNAYSLGEQVIAQLGSQDPNVKSGLAQAKLALPLLGIGLDDIKALTSGEHAVIVTKGEKYPAAVAALEVADPAKATATLDALRTRGPALLETTGTQIPPFTTVELANGVSGWQSAITPEAGVVYGVDGNLALIGTTAEAVRQVQAPVASLADDPDYQAATRQMPAKVDGVLWINGQEALTALDAAGKLKDAPADVIANLRTLTSIAAWSTNGETPTFEAFLTIK